MHGLQQFWYLMPLLASAFVVHISTSKEEVLMRAVAPDTYMPYGDSTWSRAHLYNSDSLVFSTADSGMTYTKPIKSVVRTSDGYKVEFDEEQGGVKPICYNGCKVQYQGKPGNISNLWIVAFYFIIALSLMANRFYSDGPPNAPEAMVMCIALLLFYSSEIPATMTCTFKNLMMDHLPEFPFGLFKGSTTN